VKKIIVLVASVIVVTLLCQGCVLVAGAIVADHMMNKASYSSYVNDTRKDNTEREEHGLAPNQILSYSDWKRGAGQPVGGSTNSIPEETNAPAKSPRGN